MCSGCKRFQLTAVKTLVSGLLTKDRTEASRGFQVIGTDYAGPVLYKLKPKNEGKTFLLTSACSWSRETYFGATYLISKTFHYTKREIIKNLLWQCEMLHEYLSREEIKLQCNLSRAPWWGGHCKRIIGIAKQSTKDQL